jgi:hypothetical protein
VLGSVKHTSLPHSGIKSVGKRFIVYFRVFLIFLFVALTSTELLAAFCSAVYVVKLVPLRHNKLVRLSSE